MTANHRGRGQYHQRASFGSLPVLALIVFCSAAADGQAPPKEQPQATEVHQQAARPSPSAPEPANKPVLTVVVIDDTRVAVPQAQVTLTNASGMAKCETDAAGRCTLTGLAPGRSTLRVDKEGSFAAIINDVQVGITDEAEVTLNPQRELVEQVNVVYSPPAVDPEKTVLSNTLSEHDVIDLPYAVDRDVRYLLPMLPGVVPDATAQVHVDGSDSPQTIYLLDGFTLNAPESRDFLSRVSVDAVRSISLQNSRYPAEFGGGTGGVLDVHTGMGDDRFRYSATDFIPGLTDYQGLHLGTWTPRFTISGPLDKGKAWFLLAPEGEYNETFIKSLPAGQDSVQSWRYGQLAKAQVNLAARHILSGSVLINGYGQDHAGLSIFSPDSTTLALRQSNHLLSVRDQIFLGGGKLLEVGVAEMSFFAHDIPYGNETYVISPNGTSGNYFESSLAHSGRGQEVANLTVPAAVLGHHELKFGADSERITYSESLVRNPFEVVRADGTLDQTAAFSGASSLVRNDLAAGAYAQDRWAISDRFTVSPGIRADWDEIVRKVNPAPRLAASYMLERGGETKLVGGAGLYYDTSNIGVLSLPLQGERTDTFYNTAGTAPVGTPIVTAFALPVTGLLEPRVFNWSAGLERKLPGSVYTDLEFLDKRGSDGFAYYNACTTVTNCLNGAFTLRNLQTTRYHAARITVRKNFRGDHMIFASYTESSATTNADLAFSLEAPLFSPQVGGPLPWDSPHRFISWGFLPVPSPLHRFKGYDLAYSVDVRSGYPFYTVNQNQQLVDPPGAYRYPAFFSLDLALEKRFRIFGYYWALRAGVNNVTNNSNPYAVNNNVDSPQFLTFGSSQGRVITGRIRLLGKAK